MRHAACFTFVNKTVSQLPKVNVTFNIKCPWGWQLSRNRLEAATKRRAHAFKASFLAGDYQTEKRKKRRREEWERTLWKRKHTHEKCEISFPSERILLNAAGCCRSLDVRRKKADERIFPWLMARKIKPLAMKSVVQRTRNEAVAGECSCWLSGCGWSVAD